MYESLPQHLLSNELGSLGLYGPLNVSDFADVFFAVFFGVLIDVVGTLFATSSWLVPYHHATARRGKISPAQVAHISLYFADTKREKNLQEVKVSRVSHRLRLSRFSKNI